MGTTVRNTTSLHPTTVRKVADNAIMVNRRPRKVKRTAGTRLKRRNYLDGVHPGIVAWIRENKINYRRIQIVSPTDVIIHNPGVRWR